MFSLDSFFVISLNKTLLEAKKMRHQTKKIQKLEMVQTNRAPITSHGDIIWYRYNLVTFDQNHRLAVSHARYWNGNKGKIPTAECLNIIHRCGQKITAYWFVCLSSGLFVTPSPKRFTGGKEKENPQKFERNEKVLQFHHPKSEVQSSKFLPLQFFFCLACFLLFRNRQPAKRAIRDKIMNPQLLSSISLHQPGRVMVSQLLLLSEWMIHE